MLVKGGDVKEERESERECVCVCVSEKERREQPVYMDPFIVFSFEEVLPIFLVMPILPIHLRFDRKNIVHDYNW